MGNNSALPAFERHPTAQALYFDDQIFLVDCGEGTQMQMAKYKIRRSRVNHIFISHLHGDHYFGLIGLITSMGLLGRDNPLHIYAPEQLKSIIDIQLNAASNTLNYPLEFHAITAEGILVEGEKFSVSCFPVRHRIPCWGFIFREKKLPRKIVKEKVIEKNIPATFYKRLQMGEDYNRKNGDIVLNAEVTVASTPGRSYAYCADTIFDLAMAEKVRGVDLLYHEATYLADLEERAASRFHSTTKQAALIARAAEVNRLLVGHFSSKYELLDDFLTETSEIFQNTELAIEGVTFRILPPL